MAFSCIFLHKISNCGILAFISLQYVNAMEPTLYNMKDSNILLYHNVFNISFVMIKCCTFASET